jgi:hypothetical protein
MKYEFRGRQPADLKFHIGVDPTGQTSNGNALSIDWGVDQIAEKAPVHETFTHVWRTFTAIGPAASIWLRASQAAEDPAFMVYVDNVELRQLNSGRLAPVVEISPLQIELATYVGVNPPSGMFTVRNASKVETLAYSVEENADWLLASPSEGASTGEADSIGLVYNVAGLVPGTHQAVVTVSAPGAANSPQKLLVNLVVSTLRPDFDSDGDVDDSDLAHIQSCLTGPGWPTVPECADADLDDDGDVDITDFSRFEPCVGGSNSPPPLDCIP